MVVPCEFRTTVTTRGLAPAWSGILGTVGCGATPHSHNFIVLDVKKKKGVARLSLLRKYFPIQKTNMKDCNDKNRLYAAFLASRNNSPSQIAEMLGVEAGTVTKWLNDWEAKGILARSPVLDTSRLSGEELRDIEAYDGSENLLSGIRKLTPEGVPRIRRIRVYGSGGKGESIEGLATRNKIFGYQIADGVRDLVLKSKHCMVAWGRLLGAVVEKMRDDPIIKGIRKAGIKFYPACGDPFGAFNASTTPSALCAELDRVINKNSGPHEFSFTGIPAVVPSVNGQFGSPEDIQVLKRFVGLSRAYKEVFGEAGARKDIDCILTGVGGAASGGVAAKKGYGLYTRECLRMRGVDEKWLSEHVLGDIAGVHIEKSRLRDKQKQDLAKKISLWLGVTLGDFQSCALKGAKEGKPGVVVAAIGDKTIAEVIFDCCTRLGIITELFIDCPMFEYLVAICRRESS